MTIKMATAALLSTCLVSFAGPKENSRDSDHLSKLLTDAKTEAVALQQDAQELETYTRSTNSNWKTHAVKLDQMKLHVNKTGELVQEFNSNKQEGSPWQQTAIERITPALREMANNLQATIQELNKNQSRVGGKPL